MLGFESHSILSICATFIFNFIGDSWSEIDAQFFIGDLSAFELVLYKTSRTTQHHQDIIDLVFKTWPAGQN